MSNVLVLIETYWNVNRRYAVAGLGNWGGINRNILECKLGKIMLLPHR